MPLIQPNLAQGLRDRLSDEGFSLPAISRSTVATQSTFEAPLHVNLRPIYGSNVTVGAFTNIAGGVTGNIAIGRYCAIAEQCAIGQHEHPTTWLTTFRISHVPDMYQWRRILAREVPERAGFVRTPFHGANPMTTLGNDVWIGFGAYIRAGITIGDGAIVAARSVATKDVPPFAIVAGTPDRIIERLMRLRWWDYCLFDFAVDFSTPEQALDVIEQQIAERKIPAYEAARSRPAILPRWKRRHDRERREDQGLRRHHGL